MSASTVPARTEAPGTIRVVQIITRLIAAGAQETAVLTAAHLDPALFSVEIWAGPQSGNEGDLRPRCRDAGIPVRTVPHLRRELDPIADTRAFAELVAMLRRHRCHVVHTHSSKAGILGRFAARAARVPAIVHTVHGWSFHDRMSPRSYRLYAGLERAAARVTQRLITVSRADVEKGLAEGIGDRSRYTTIRSAIDLSEYARPADRAAVREALDIPGAAPLVITVGRISTQKDPLAFAAVAARVLKTQPHAVLAWVGDGPLRPELERELDRLGIRASVRLLGVRGDVPALLAAADVFLLTSLWEGLPRVLVEAAAAGLPAVATRVDGTPELVTDGETGFLCPSGDVETMAGRVGELLANPEARRRLGAAAARSLGREFTVAEMTENLARVYRDLAATGAAWTPATSSGRTA